MSKLENVKTPENPSGAINLRYTRTLLYHFAGIFISSCSHLQIRRCEPDRSMNKQRLVLKTSRYIIAAYPVLLLCFAGVTLGAGRSDVAEAVMKGDKAAVGTLIVRKSDVNAPQVDGATALHWAVDRDDLETADLLIRDGAKANVANREGTTPLAMACLYGNAPMIEKLLKAGADAKERNRNSETTLMFAARNGNPDAIKLLLAAGVDVNAKETMRGTTALMWAVEQKHPAAVKSLLDDGADFRARSASAGLPRNYMAQRVNTAQVDAAVRRHAAAAAAGRTYQEQVEFEEANGVLHEGRRIVQAARPAAPAAGQGTGAGQTSAPAATGAQPA